MAEPAVLQEAFELQQMKFGLADRLAALSQQFGLPDSLGSVVVQPAPAEASATASAIGGATVEESRVESATSDMGSNTEQVSLAERSETSPSASALDSSELGHRCVPTIDVNETVVVHELDPAAMPTEASSTEGSKVDAVLVASNAVAQKEEKNSEERVPSSVPAAFRKGRVPSRPVSVVNRFDTKAVEANTSRAGNSFGGSATGPIAMWPISSGMMMPSPAVGMMQPIGAVGMATMGGMCGIGNMPGMLGMGMLGMHGMGSMPPSMPGMPALGGMPGAMDFSGIAGLPSMGICGMMPDAAAAVGSVATEEDEKESAIREAVEATQHAQYMQQVQFLQQMRAQASQVDPSKGTRFKDDYRPLRLCRHFMIAECLQGERCIYAHCFEELHPASPDLPKSEDTSTGALAEMKPQEKEKEGAPNMRLRKKRDLCKKFMETGACLRGKACPYAHGEHEIGAMAFVLYDKVKLKICPHWAQGRCIYEDKCINAHGKIEIGQKRRDFFDMPPVKRRREDESIEEWRSSILKNPSRSPF